MLLLRQGKYDKDLFAESIGIKTNWFKGFRQIPLVSYNEIGKYEGNKLTSL